MQTNIISKKQKIKTRNNKAASRKTIRTINCKKIPRVLKTRSIRDAQGKRIYKGVILKSAYVVAKQILANVSFISINLAKLFSNTNNM